MKWVLIWIVVAGDGVTTSSHEFNTEKECIAASLTLNKDDKKGFYKTNAYCFSSGEPK